jgi:hypothetical protein
MVIPGQWNGKPLTISVKTNCITVSIGNPVTAEVFSYDFAGRMWTAFLEGIAYRRGLNGKMLVRWRSLGEARGRRWLPPDEGRIIESRGLQQMTALYDAIQSGEAALKAVLPESGHLVFRRVIAFDESRSAADAQQYHQVYQPVGILPPDQYMAVVLQATEGCSFNTCTFCTFYKNRPFHIKSPDEFRAHAEAVRDFLGDGLSLRRTIFLGDANSIVTPMPKLLPLLDIVHQVYDVKRLGGIYAFLDGFSGEKKSAADYAALREKGVRMLYIGLESGSPDLLQFLKKPGTPDDAVNAVRAIKNGGIAVGLIVLLGAGGKQYAEAHVRDTINVLNAMQLDKTDLIYFSELFGDETPYAQDAIQAGLQPLSHDDCIAQQQAIQRGLIYPNGLPRISRYDIREFIY